MKFKDISLFGDLTGVENDLIVVIAEAEPYKGQEVNVSIEFERIKRYNFSFCKGIKSLEGAPKKCKKFDCSYCSNLPTLEYSPKECEIFDCSWCSDLKDLKGAPEVCNFFDCYSCNSLESLEGVPKNCKKVNCFNCPKLKNLDPLLCFDIDVDNIIADEKLLEDYLKKKKIVEKYGYEKAMAVLDMLDDLV